MVISVALLRILVIRLNNIAHQPVPHHISAVEKDKIDSFDILEDFLDLLKIKSIPSTFLRISWISRSEEHNV